MSDAPDESKLTRTKLRWAAEGRFLTGRTVRPDAERLPPGQHLVRNWPVLDLGLQPEITPERFRLKLYGAVSRPTELDWAALAGLPQSRFTSDIHCVTTWSRFDNRWDGVATRDLAALVEPRPEARFVSLESLDGYTTNLRLDDFLVADALLATRWEDAPIPPEHGGPARLVVPHLYFWKSAKWLRAIAFTAENKPGYWETRGYHDRGDPWAEERYDDD